MHKKDQRIEKGPLLQKDEKNRPLVSIIIPVLNKWELTRDCLLAIERNTDHGMIEVIVVDNASTDDTRAFLSDWKGPFPLKVIHNNKNKGYAEANNQGAEMARGHYLVLLNNDTEPKSDWLPSMLRVFDEHANVGAVGAKLLYPDGTIQHAGIMTIQDGVRKIPLIPVHFGYKKQDAPGFNKFRKCPAVTGACVVVPKSVYQKVKGLDTAFWNGFEDVDFCFKLLEEGLDIFFQPESVIVHHESQSGPERYVRDNENFLELNRRWKDRITCELIVKEKNRLVPNDGATLVVVTHNAMNTIGKCLTRLEATIRQDDEVIIVDNGSADRTREIVHQFIDGKAQFKLIQNEDNLGYAHGINMGAKAGANPYIVFMDPEVRVTAQWIERLVFHLRQHKVAAVGPILTGIAGSQQMASLYIDEKKDHCDKETIEGIAWAKHARTSCPVKLLENQCLMVKRKAFNRINGLDPALFGVINALDFSWRLQQLGYGLAVAKDTVMHSEKLDNWASQSNNRTDYLSQESTDFLYHKLFKHYGENNIPKPRQLWGIDGFSPSVVFKETQPLTSIIMLTFNQLTYTRQCIQSIFENTWSPYELVIVDNGSKDDSLDYLSSLDRSKTACIRIKIISNKTNKGFAGGCNQAMEVAQGEQFLLLNNDVVVPSGWLSKLSKALKQSQVGLSGPVSNSVAGRQMINSVSYDEETLSGFESFAEAYAKQHAGKTVHNWRLVGFCLLVKREIIEKIGGLDERFKVGNFEDDDFCIRAYLAGFKAVIVKDCFIHHFGSRSFVGNQIDINERLLKNWEVFKTKWGISPETPYTAQYHVPVPDGGFDSTKHFVPIETDQKKTSAFGQECRVAALPSTDCRSFTTKSNNQESIKSKKPGGISMQILDNVLNAIQDPFFSDKKDEAVWILERLIEAAPEHGDAHYGLGMLYYEKEELAKAQAHLNQAVRFCPDNHRYYKTIGDFYHVVHKDNNQALRMYEKAIEYSPTDGQLLLIAGHLCTAEKCFDKAMAYYQRVLEVEPGNQEVQDCLNKIKKNTESHAPGDTIESLYEQAQEFISGGDRERAVACLKKIIEKAPDHALAHNDCAVLAYELGDKETAVHYYEKAVSINPENLNFLKNLADFYWWEQRNGHAAMKLYVQILSKDPADVETILSCAQICIALDKFDDARELVDRARAIAPFDENASVLSRQLEKQQRSNIAQNKRDRLYQKAKALATEGDLKGAVEVLTEMVQQHRQDGQGFNDLGVLYYELGQKEKAFSCYREAVKLEPHQDTYLKNLADFYMVEQGRVEDAMKLYLAVLENNPKDIDCLLATGFVCLSQNQPQDARGFFEQVMQIDPINSAALQAIKKIDQWQQDDTDTPVDLNATLMNNSKEAFG